MEIGVLGPLRVVEGGTPFPLGGPRARSLLALLVAAGGAPVSMDSLVIGIYGPDADPGLRRSIQTYVSTFRRSLGDIIDRGQEGYVLTVPPGDIDAARFQASLRTARSLVDEAASAALLHEALSLWRGSPYADVEARAALQAEITRLEELRAEAVGARIDLDLAAGRHRELIPELESLIAQHPTWERLRGHLMLALYRSGRQADALQAYSAAEEYLRDELGIDPSRDIQRLELQILQQDQELDYRPKPRARPVPARYTSFVGRAEEVADVAELVRSHRLVTVTGSGGIGKSSLAAEVAGTLAAEMATGFVPVETERSTDLLSLVATSLGLQPASDADVVELIGRTIGDTPTLLVLDGCEHIIDAVPPVVDRLLRRCASLRVLVTSREALFVTGEHRFTLGPLGHGAGSAADHLFADRAGLRLAGLDAADRTWVTTIGTRLDGIPLALELAAAQTRGLSVAEVAARLDRQTDLLAAPRSTDERHGSIVDALDWSYRLLDETLQVAFRRLAVFRGGVSVGGAGYVVDSDDAAGLLERLADRSLLVRSGDGYRLLEPIRQYAWKLLADGGELGAVRRRHAEWTVQRCRQIASGYEIDRAPEALQALRVEGPEIAATAEWALAEGMPQIVIDIVAAVGRRWPRVLDGRRLRELARAALDRVDPADPQVLVATANTAALFREHDRAYAIELMGRVEAMADEVEEVVARFHATSVLALLRYSLRLEPRERVVELQQSAIELAHAASQPPEGQFHNLALMQLRSGHEAECRATVAEWAAWADESKPIDRGQALLLRAILARVDGDLEQALDYARESARMLVDAGDFDQAAEAEYERARLLVLLDRSEQAADAIARVDELHDLIGLPPARVEDPALPARIAGDLCRWDEFEELMTAWADLSGGPQGPELLAGDPLAISHLALLLGPTVRWLQATGHREDATRLAGAVEMVLAETPWTRWDAIGEAQRLRALATEVEAVTDGSPEDQEALFDLMAGGLSAGEGNESPDTHDASPLW